MENKVLRQILGEGFAYEELANEEVRRLTGQPLITGVIKSSTFSWEEHVSRETPTLYIRLVLDGRPASPRLQGRPRLQWKHNESKDTGWLGVPD